MAYKGSNLEEIRYQSPWGRVPGQVRPTVLQRYPEDIANPVRQIALLGDKQANRKAFFDELLEIASLASNHPDPVAEIKRLRAIAESL